MLSAFKDTNKINFFAIFISKFKSKTNFFGKKFPLIHFFLKFFLELKGSKKNDRRNDF